MEQIFVRFFPIGQRVMFCPEVPVPGPSANGSTGTILFHNEHICQVRFDVKDNDGNPVVTNIPTSTVRQLLVAMADA